MSPPFVPGSAEPAPPELTPAVATVPTLIDFVNNVPSPLTALLIELSPHIAWIRATVESLSWKSSYSASWLLIAGWWAICLLSPFTFKYILPPLIILAYPLRTRFQSYSRPPVTEQTLQSIIIDLSAISSLIPDPPDLSAISYEPLIRVIAVLYIPYLLLTHLVRLRVLVAVLGTTLLTFRAPWAKTLRQILWRSAWFRRNVSRLWARLSGIPAAHISFALRTETTPGQTAEPLRFIFTVLENQRWWVGLDWTAALIPSERPSWCSLSLQPQAPPSAFSLPGPTTIFIGDGKGGMVKRSAQWCWEESEWKVIVRREQQGVRRVEMALPVGKEESLPSSSKLDKTVKKVMEAKEAVKDVGRRHQKSVSEASTGDVEIPESSGQEADEAGGPEEEVSNDPFTDADGWVYGDNQWKGLSSQGGIGKYTRYRKWTRIAVLVETVEPASAEEAQAQTKRISTGYQETITTVLREKAEESQISGSVKASTEEDDSDGSHARKGLRNRLKAVVHSSTRT